MRHLPHSWQNRTIAGIGMRIISIFEYWMGIEVCRGGGRVARHDRTPYLSWVDASPTKRSNLSRNSQGFASPPQVECPHPKRSVARTKANLPRGLDGVKIFDHLVQVAIRDKRSGKFIHSLTPAMPWYRDSVKKPSYNNSFSQKNKNKKEAVQYPRKAGGTRASGSDNVRLGERHP